MTVFGLNVILGLLLIHWVADFVLQSHDMAINKSKSMYWLSLHVDVYTITLFVLSFAILGDTFLPPLKLFMWAIANGLLHLITDYFTSRINSRLWERGHIHWFFVSVGFDQFIHYSCLFGTASLMYS